MMKVAGHSFPIRTARLEPFYSDDEDLLCWGVFCVADGGQVFGGQDPCINFDRLFVTRPGQLASWKDLAGMKLGWSNPADGPEGLFSVWEGEEIRDCQWELVRGEGKGLIVKVQGVTDIRGDAPFDRDVPFVVEAPLSIHRWPMGRAKKADCLEIYRHLGLEDAVEFREVDGVSFLLFV